MPASQLSQLKAALQSSGLNRKSTGKKEKKAFKKGGAREVDRQKKFDKLDEIRKSLNKFDERETKTKYDVGGRKLSGVTGRPSAAKQAGLEQRKKTLLPEHQLRGHMGTFNDRRFGESNPSLSIEEKLQERYTRERQRGQGRKGMFNLEEDGADLFGFEDEGQALGGLTHGGRSVNELKGDDFVAQGFGEDDEDEDKGRVSRDQVRRAHFGGFEQGEEEEDKPDRKRSRQEIMNEVIAKSKEHKYARQQQQEEDAEMRDELDADIADLQALLAESAPTKAAPGSSAAALSGEAAYAARAARTAPATSTPAGPNGADEDGTYDSMVRELAFDARAKPKDRTKTEGELALEEKEKLEAAEAKRLRRMRGEESDEEAEEEGARGKRRRKGDKEAGRREADDLDDDYQEEDLLGPGLTREDIENMGKGEQGSDEEDEDDEDEDGSGEEDDDEASGDGDEEDEDEEDSDDESEASSMADLDEDAPELLSVDEDVDMADEIVKGKKKRDAATASGKRKAKTVDIPFTFACPETIEEFEDIMEPLDDAAPGTVVQRIRALHHPSLAEGNKDKLQHFLGVLLDYILLLASRPTPAFQVISSLYPHIIALVKLNAITAAHHFLAKLTLMQKNLTRGLARGPADPRAKTWPGAAELTLLRLVGMIWSTSDFSHPVVAPAMLLMGQYLSQGRVRDTADLASGLFLCSLVAQYEADSKRMVPEALNFIGNTFTVLLKRKKDASTLVSFPDVLAPNVELYLTSDATPSQPADLAACLSKEDADSDKAKAELLSIALRLVPTYAGMYASHEAFVELFTPVKRVLEGSRVNKLSPELKTLHTSTLSTLSRQLSNTLTSRAPLAMQAHKPVPIASHAPKFESDFAPGKHYDPDVERSANAKLKSQYKKERKGAIRELRKDNRFLADHKAREQKEKDDAYNAKMRKVEGSLQSERAEEKGMQREKEREKRRAGRG